jgi:trehalose 6-phosphate synthase/phosphatase
MEDLIFYVRLAFLQFSLLLLAFYLYFYLKNHFPPAALALPSVEVGRRALKEKHGNRVIVAGIDIGQRLSGTSLKLLAYERLLHDYPSWQTKVVMVHKVLLPGSRKADESLTVKELRVLVQRIQDKFGSAVIDYQEIVGSSSIPIDQRLALWKASDVFMCTPIREGLNHWPMEYIYAKDKAQPGVIIASEFTAMCSILNGALRVNPFDIQMTITIIDKALSMEMAEREGRHYRDIDFVSNSPSDKWVRNVLRDLKDAARKQNDPVSSANNSSSATPTTPRWTSSPSTTARDELKGTAAFLMRESNAAFVHVNLHSLKQAYESSSRRVIVLDFNGTIVLKEPPGKYLKREILGTSGNKPPPQVLESLALLCSDKRNTVLVVSGDSSENLLNAVGHIPDLGLAFSNGAKFSRPTPAGVQRTWQTFDLGVDWDAVKRVGLENLYCRLRSSSLFL